MSLTGTLSNAISGLSAAARSAELVSTNLANAMTEGYARRELVLASTKPGGPGGVRVDGVQRLADPALAQDLRLAVAGRDAASARADALSRLEALFGLPGEPGALTARVTAFEARLSEAAADPSATVRLDAAVLSASDLVTGITRAADGIQALRTEADREIAGMVSQINDGLSDVAGLNQRIQQARAAGRDTAGLEDVRQQAIDALSGLVPLREVRRDGGSVALYSMGGAILLDGSPARLDFTPARSVTPYMTLQNGQLSGLTLSGIPLRTGADGQVSGGALGAAFELRDELAVSAQSRLDAFARDLVERVSAPGVDPTLAPGAPGLFTDAGTAFLPADEPGLSQRLALNPAIDPEGGGATWRLRAGLGAAVPGASGAGSILLALGDSLSTPRMPASGDFGALTVPAAGLAAEIVSSLGALRQHGEGALSFANAAADELAQERRRLGVDTDQEMQKLLVVETLYNANARVIQAVDDMLDTLTRL